MANNFVATIKSRRPSGAGFAIIMNMKNSDKVTKKITAAVTETVVEVDKVVDQAEADLDKAIDPVRKKAIKRFPTLFLLVVTFGATAVITGFEQLLFKYDVLLERPWIILAIGIITLVLTGKLYKKLD